MGKYFKNVDILQFNLERIPKHFFSLLTQSVKILIVSILEKLKELKLTVVITLDKLGAICVIKNVDKIIYAQELVSKKILKIKLGLVILLHIGIVYELMKIVEV